jgi:hypothetical protein
MIDFLTSFVNHCVTSLCFHNFDFLKLLLMIVSTLYDILKQKVNTITNFFIFTKKAACSHNRLLLTQIIVYPIIRMLSVIHFFLILLLMLKKVIMLIVNILFPNNIWNIRKKCLSLHRSSVSRRSFGARYI